MYGCKLGGVQEELGHLHGGISDPNSQYHQSMMACYWSLFADQSPSICRECTASLQGGYDVDGAWSPSSWSGGACRIRGCPERGLL